ncbi:MAG: hypothetical protein R2713_15815 [Ilumatobacteraceae bacterium]
MVVAAAISAGRRDRVGGRCHRRFALLVVGSIVGIAAISAPIPLTTATYERNFAADRGRRVGRGMAVRVAVGALAGLWMGQLLKHHPDRWWQLLVLAAVALALVGVGRRTSRPSRSHRWTAAHGRSPLPSARRGPAAATHTDRLDAHGVRQPDAAAAARRVPGEPAVRHRRRRGADHAAHGDGALDRAARACRCSSLFDRLSFFLGPDHGEPVVRASTSPRSSGRPTSACSSVRSCSGPAARRRPGCGFWVTKFALPAGGRCMGLHTFFTGVRRERPMLGFLVIERFDLETVA